MAIMNEQEKEALVRYVLAKLAEAPQLVESNIKKGRTLLPHRRVYSRLRKHVDEFLMGEELGSITNRLILLPGLRGVGKTTLLFQLYRHLTEIKKIEQDRILYISADELKAYMDKGILDAIDVYIKEIHKTTLTAIDKELFIFIDEAHFDKKWSEVAKVIFDKSKKVFMIFTGSSALSLELNVDTARRIKKETAYPLNFAEYLSLKYEIYPPSTTSWSIRDLIFNFNEETLKNMQSKENDLTKKLIMLNKPIDKEWDNFVCCKGFPFGLEMPQIEIHERLFSMVDKVIEKDVFSLQSFNTESRNTIKRILSFLALQKPGGTSDAKLSERLGKSPTGIRNILEVLEKTHLILSVKPYGGAGKTVGKPWKYYFLSSSLNAALRFKLGSYDERDKEMLGIFAETLVASSLFRMKETVNMPSGIFYDSGEGGVDFLLFDAKERIIPLEVGIGRKDKKQINNAIKKYNSPYGIIVDNSQKISVEDNIIRIPLIIFSFV